MLHDDFAFEPEVGGNTRRQVAGMQVAHRDPRVDAEQRPIPMERFPEMRHRLEPLEVADVRTDIGGTAADQGEGVLEMWTDGYQWDWRRDRKRERQRCIPAGTAQEYGCAIHEPNHRVIHPREDFPVVQQEDVGNPVQAPARLFIADRDWLVAEVATGHDERNSCSLEQELVERCVWQHHANPADTRSQGISAPRVAVERARSDAPARVPGSTRRRT